MCTTSAPLVNCIMEVETAVRAHEPAADPPQPLRYSPALQLAHELHASDPDDVL